MVIHVTKDADVEPVPTSLNRPPVEDEPRNAAEEPVQDAEMDEVEPEQDVHLPQLPQSQDSTSSGLELAVYRPPSHAFQEDRLVFQLQVERSRRPLEPVCLPEDGLDATEEQSAEGSDGPPSPKRARTDEDDLIAETVLAYAASVNEGADPLATYAEAMASDESVEWWNAMKAGLFSHRQAFLSLSLGSCPLASHASTAPLACTGSKPCTRPQPS